MKCNKNCLNAAASVAERAEPALLANEVETPVIPLIPAVGGEVAFGGEAFRRKFFGFKGKELVGGLGLGGDGVPVAGDVLMLPGFQYHVQCAAVPAVDAEGDSRCRVEDGEELFTGIDVEQFSADRARCI